MDKTADIDPSKAPETRSARKHGYDNPWLDIIPMLIFAAAFHAVRFHRPEDALFIAAAIFAVAAIIALLFGLWRYRRLSIVLLASTVIIVGSAALAVLFGNKLFVFMRPTVINGGIGLAALTGILIKRNVIRSVLGRAVALPDAAWTVLAWRWGLFFLLIAITNEFIWRTQSEAVWINVKTFGFAPTTALFSAAQIPFIRAQSQLLKQGL